MQPSNTAFNASLLQPRHHPFLRIHSRHPEDITTALFYVMLLDYLGAQSSHTDSQMHKKEIDSISILCKQAQSFLFEDWSPCNVLKHIHQFSHDRMHIAPPGLPSWHHFSAVEYSM